MMSKLRLFYLCIFSPALVLSIAFTSCNTLMDKTGFGDMMALRDSVSHMIKADNVSINITNGKYLTVSIINSAYNDSGSQIQQRLAREIGEIAYSTVCKKNHIIRGHVNYVTNHSFLIFHSTSSIGVDMDISRLINRDSTGQRPI